MPLILAIDTATGTTGVALIRDGAILAKEHAEGSRRSAEKIFSTIDGVLDRGGVTKDALEGVAVTTGPGAFTGLRVGIAIAKGLATGLGLKIAGVSTLKALSLNVTALEGILAVAIDARKGQVYSAAYDGETGEELLGEGARDPEAFREELLSLCRPVLLIGSGAGAYPQMFFTENNEPITPGDNSLWEIDPASVALLGEGEFMAGAALPPELLAPRYLRLSEAEEKKAAGTLGVSLKI
ncbi:MAG: tRNA (adenosine(37)-N6)-threonylcarbamoyltransferase complex dimerization subunit type 1 TsaB [Deltaproteobacteria bacterium]|nr:MAG: tRNA (adenosine(37)-N6)-threonylcarbamoyltransferase complex dimerization subunit type 1 TsaB [Deltaproteobacteria bacterium]